MDDPFALQTLAQERISEIQLVSNEQSQGRAALRRLSRGRGVLLAWRCSVGQALIQAGVRLIGPDARC